MSSILEALKKLEEEKAARRGGMGNLAGRVAKTGRRSRQTSTWLLAGGMLAIAAVSALATYFAINGSPSSRSKSASSAKPPDVSRAPAVPLPPTGLPVTDMLNPRQPDLTPMKKGERISNPLPDSTIRDASHLPDSSQSSAGLEPSTPGESPHEAAGAPRPAFSVAGIAWQKDNAFRMAVVNGVPVREGDTVEGSTVKEILADRVRFSFNGKEFEVPMEK